MRTEIRTAGVAFGLRFHQEEEMYNKKGPLSARWDEDDVEVQYMIVQTKLSKLRFNCKRSALPKCTHSPHVPHQQQEHRFRMDLRAAETFANSLLAFAQDLLGKAPKSLQTARLLRGC